MRNLCNDMLIIVDERKKELTIFRLVDKNGKIGE